MAHSHHPHDHAHGACYDHAHGLHAAEGGVAPGSGGQGRASRRLTVALGVIVVFMVVEIVGGLLSGSLALLADAAHMFTDSLALVLALIAQIVSKRPADTTLHYGYSRAQVLAAFANGVLLFTVIFWIVVEAGRRFFDPVTVLWQPMLTVAVLGLAANAAAFALLHADHERNVNVKGALLHVVSDLLGSAAAIVAALAIMAGGPSWIDAALSVFVSALIGRSAWRLVSETGHILLQGAPKNLNIDAMADDLRLVDEEILDVHDVRVWQLTPDESRVTLHVRVRDRARAEAALEKVKARLVERFNIRQSTVQLELGSVCPDLDAALAREVERAAAAPVPPSVSESDSVVALRGRKRGQETPPSADPEPPLNHGGLRAAP